MRQQFPIEDAEDNFCTGSKRSNDFGPVRHTVREGRTLCGLIEFESNPHELDCDDCGSAYFAEMDGAS